MKPKIPIFLFIILICTTLAFSQSYKVNSANGVTFRETPSTSAKSLGNMGKGEKIKVLEKTNDKWYKVEYNGQVGYVYSDYIEKDDDNKKGSNENRENEKRDNANKSESKNRSNRDSGPKKKSSSGDNASNSSNSSSSERNWGIGIRLGDPSGLTFKKYFGSNALEISVGRSHIFSGNGWYDKRFDNWYGDWYKDHQNYKDFKYLGYGGTSIPLAIQVHYLFQKDIRAVENLQWYIGFGGQLRHQRYSFAYRYKFEGSDVWYYGEEKFTDIDLGIDGVIGLEYHIPNVPISIFADATLFGEIVNNPFLFWLQGGIGARYNFK